MVTNARSCQRWCVNIEWIPLLRRLKLDFFKESQQNGQIQHHDKGKELQACRIIVTIDIDKETNVEESDKFWIPLQGQTRPGKQEPSELKQVQISKVQISQAWWVSVREDKFCPDEEAASLHEIAHH